MDFWGYPSDSCLFADNPKNPVTDEGIKQNKNIRHLIFYILMFCFVSFLYP